ncbi:unnamed protein product, partial [Leptidea sinapis]
MVLSILSLVLKFISLICVIAVAGLWAGADIDTRPKNRDEQTLLGGVVWSQIILPVGLIISMLSDNDMGIMVHGYFLFIGSFLLVITGVLEIE